jgi:hypothetical protein
MSNISKIRRRMYEACVFMIALAYLMVAVVILTGAA